jgi:hypothetical protein
VSNPQPPDPQSGALPVSHGNRVRIYSHTIVLSQKEKVKNNEKLLGSAMPAQIIAETILSFHEMPLLTHGKREMPVTLGRLEWRGQLVHRVDIVRDGDQITTNAGSDRDVLRSGQSR